MKNFVGIALFLIIGLVTFSAQSISAQTTQTQTAPPTTTVHGKKVSPMTDKSKWPKLFRINMTPDVKMMMSKAGYDITDNGIMHNGRTLVSLTDEDIISEKLRSINIDLSRSSILTITFVRYGEPDESYEYNIAEGIRDSKIGPDYY